MAALLAPVALGAALVAFMATRALMPGVKTTTDVRSGAGATLREIGSQYMVAGMTERGPTAATMVESYADYAKIFGGVVPYGYLARDLQTYFAEGGTRAWVRRVVGPAATVGSLTLQDRAGVPLGTVRLDASSAGAWSADIDVTVADGAVADTVTVTVAYREGQAGEIIEIYRNQTAPGALVDAINARSTLVAATDLGSATAAPDNLPVAVAAVSLAGGADDQASVDAAMIGAALDSFGAAVGPAAVATPGYPVSDTGVALMAHARATRRIALAHSDAGETDATVKGVAASVVGSVGGEFTGLFWPWVEIPDPAGGETTIPPTGYVAGRRAAAYQQFGPTQPPAGKYGQAEFVRGVETDVDGMVGDDVNGENVSAIRIIQDSVRIYGWRSLSDDTDNWYHLSQRDALNAVAWEAEQALEDIVFTRIDSRGKLVAKAEGILEGIAERYRQADELYEKRTGTGELVDPGYSVSVVPDVANRRLQCTLAVRFAEAGELVEITIIKVASDAAV